MKICGITNPADAIIAEEAGADAIGVVVFSDSPRSVSIERAEEIFDAAGPFVTRVCVSHTASLGDIEAMLDIHPDSVQLMVPVVLPSPFPARLIRAVSSGRPHPADADALLVDASSGTGKLYDADFASRIVRESSVPVILAGGLHPGNVAEAVRHVRPYGVDVATGVEDAPGIKNARKVQAFIRNAKGDQCD